MQSIEGHLNPEAHFASKRGVSKRLAPASRNARDATPTPGASQPVMSFFGEVVFLRQAQMPKCDPERVEMEEKLHAPITKIKIGSRSYGKGKYA